MEIKKILILTIADIRKAIAEVSADHIQSFSKDELVNALLKGEMNIPTEKMMPDHEAVTSFQDWGLGVEITARHDVDMILFLKLQHSFGEKEYITLYDRTPSPGQSS